MTIKLLVCPHYTRNRFSCRHENVSVKNWNKSSTHIEHRTRAAGLPRGQFGVLNHSPLSWKYAFISVGPSPCSLLLILLENLFTLRRKVAETYPIYDDPLFNIDGGAVSLLNRNCRKITVLLYELTEAKSGIFFVSVRGLSGIVWLIIAFRVPQTPDINLPHNSVATIQCYERFNWLG